jgi:hypothetical protein
VKNARKSFKEEKEARKNNYNCRQEQVETHTLIEENKQMKSAYKRRKSGLKIKKIHIEENHRRYKTKNSLKEYEIVNNK